MVSKRVLFALHWYSESLHAGVSRFGVERGWSVIQATTDTVGSISPEDFDGVVCGIPNSDQHPVHRLIADSGKPVVELSYAFPEYKKWARCPSDGIAVGRLAAEHLGRRPVAGMAFVAAGRHPTDLIRETGFRQGLAAQLDGRPYSDFFLDETNGLTSDAIPTKLGSASHKEIQERLKAFLLGAPRPLGVFGSVDAVAKLVFDAASEVELKTPGDLYLMGFGNRELTSRIAPVPITTIDIDYKEWGYAAAGLLDELMSGKVAPGTVRPFAPGSLVVRDSTGGESGGDPLCARALELMNKHVSDPLDIPQLAARLGTSPSTLKRTFAQNYGTGVAAYYLALRIEVAKGLLAAGNKVDSVAASVGFASPRAFRTAFIKATGVKPGEYEP